jgi:hypothetical protein
MIHDGWKGNLWPAIKYFDMTVERRNCVTKKVAGIAMKPRHKRASMATNKTHHQTSRRNDDFFVVQDKDYIAMTPTKPTVKGSERVRGSQSRQTVKCGHEPRRTPNQNHFACEDEQSVG